MLRPPSSTTERLEAFSDGVIAIAITLLVLEIRPPEHGGEGLAHGLVELWPSYLAYTLSFVTIGSSNTCSASSSETNSAAMRRCSSS